MPIVPAYSDGDILIAGSLNLMRTEVNNNLVFTTGSGQITSGASVQVIGSAVTAANDLTLNDMITMNMVYKMSGAGPTGSANYVVRLSGTNIGVGSFAGDTSIGTGNRILIHQITSELTTPGIAEVHRLVGNAAGGATTATVNSVTMTGTWITGAFVVFLEGITNDATNTNFRYKIRRN